MNKCEICHDNVGTFSAIIDEIYYKNLCLKCKSKNIKISSGHARWARSVDLEDHEADIMQPFNADGSINTRFAKLYPKQAAELFDQQQLRDAELK